MRGKSLLFLFALLCFILAVKGQNKEEFSEQNVKQIVDSITSNSPEPLDTNIQLDELLSDANVTSTIEPSVVTTDEYDITQSTLADRGYTRAESTVEPTNVVPDTTTLPPYIETTLFEGIYASETTPYDSVIDSTTEDNMESKKTTESILDFLQSFLPNNSATTTTTKTFKDNKSARKPDKEILKCVGKLHHEPILQRQACMGNRYCSMVACGFLLIMILFSFIKVLTVLGCKKLFDPRVHGTSYPQRPELLVIFCSTLPLVFTILCRPLFRELHPRHKQYIMGCGLAQTRMFFDLFARSGSVYHMIYWAYRMPIIRVIWQIFTFGKKFVQNMQKKSQDENQIMSKIFSKGIPQRGRNGQRTGRTRVHHSIDGRNKRQPKEKKPPKQSKKHGKKSQKWAANVVDPYSFNLGNSYSPGGMYSGDLASDPYGYDPFLLDGNAMAFDDEKPMEEEKPPKPQIPRQFIIYCKWIIPSVIYAISAFIALPVISSFECEHDKKNDYYVAKVTKGTTKFFYYDLVCIILLPMLIMVVGFFHGTLSKVQLNGEDKMHYRLRCYYVTFIVLNIPMLVLMLVYIYYTNKTLDFKFPRKFGNGVIIATTAYHTQFVLKSMVHATACNMICCSDRCLQRHGKVRNWIVNMTTPIVVKTQQLHDSVQVKDRQLIPVIVDSA